MREVKTYFIKRNNVCIWLGVDIIPLETDTILEERPMLVADEGKALMDENNNVIGVCVWNKDNHTYTEIDEPVEEEITEGEIIEED